ncbi:hypothetical protein B0O99DRAFT_343683 [Bisporella sp. PMI_857]|nr:hypothetical protein B0O99DRAFT_343683 [Bisporella sp. PMI_857]
MSTPQAARTGAAPKAMSSRLLTMKFMQRAAASPSTASSAPSTPDEPSPKRRKRNTGSPSTPSFNVNELANQRAVDRALAEEDAKRQAALERQAAEAGDTRWVLSFEDQQAADSAARPLSLRVVSTGYASLDVRTPMQIRKIDTEEDSSSEEQPVIVGRRSFGKFNRKVEKQLDPTIDTSSEDDAEDVSESAESNDSESEGDDSDDPAAELIRATRAEAALAAKEEQKGKKKSEKKKTAQLAKDRKKKEVNLNGLTSLSGRGVPTIECFNCGGPHKKQDCPKGSRKRAPPDGQGGNFTKKSRITRGMGH